VLVLEEAAWGEGYEAVPEMMATASESPPLRRVRVRFTDSA